MSVNKFGPMILFRRFIDLTMDYDRDYIILKSSILRF